MVPAGYIRGCGIFIRYIFRWLFSAVVKCCHRDFLLLYPPFVCGTKNDIAYHIYKFLYNFHKSAAVSHGDIQPFFHLEAMTISLNNMFTSVSQLSANFWRQTFHTSQALYSPIRLPLTHFSCSLEPYERFTAPVGPPSSISVKYRETLHGRHNHAPILFQRSPTSIRGMGIAALNRALHG